MYKETFWVEEKGAGRLDIRQSDQILTEMRRIFFEIYDDEYKLLFPFNFKMKRTLLKYEPVSVLDSRSRHTCFRLE